MPANGVSLSTVPWCAWRSASICRTRSCSRSTAWWALEEAESQRCPWQACWSHPWRWEASCLRGEHTRLQGNKYVKPRIYNITILKHGQCLARCESYWARLPGEVCVRMVHILMHRGCPCASTSNNLITFSSFFHFSLNNLLDIIWGSLQNEDWKKYP